MTTQPLWVSVHIYYNSDPTKLLTNCIRPLVAEAERRGLLARYFYIRYWENGPHIRLRFKAAEGAARSELLRYIEEEVTAFLRERPALFRHPTTFMPAHYRDQFISEYGMAELIAKYGEAGEIPYRENNSIMVETYVPEFHRYGGAPGVEIAERYFDNSSRFALEQLSSPNGHDFSVVLAHALKTFIFFNLIFFDENSRVDFSRGYQAMWTKFSVKDVRSYHDGLRRKFERQREKLVSLMSTCQNAMESDGDSLDHRWIRVLRDLKHDIDDANLTSQLPRIEDRNKVFGTYSFLLPSYMHMHSNRLGLAMSDEPYVAYLASRTFEEQSVAVA